MQREIWNSFVREAIFFFSFNFLRRTQEIILERLSLCLERIKRIWNATFGWNVSRDRHVCETQVCRNIEVFLKNPFSFWNTIGISFLFVYSILGASWNFVANLSCETIEIVINFSAILSRRKAFEVYNNKCFSKVFTLQIFIIILSLEN